MFIVFIKGSGKMGERFDNPEEMGRWIAQNIHAGQTVIVQLYV